MQKLDYKKLIGFIFLSLLLANVKNVSAQSAATRILPDPNENEVITAILSSGNGKHYFNHIPKAENNNLPADHDTVRYFAMVDATNFVAQKNKEEIVSKPDTSIVAPSTLELDPGTALNAVFKEHSILFAYRDSRLTETSMKVLDKVAFIMLKNPDAVFELGAHTDARGIYSDNMALSKARMNNAAKYLMGKGVPQNQIVAVAYGETALKNVCDSDSHCSEEVHAGNRRLEINVIGIKK
jgi:outer membrane protein OmpA-like peptidoglycan-associated protein